jgi:hypothetical protein
MGIRHHHCRSHPRRDRQHDGSLATSARALRQKAILHNSRIPCAAEIVHKRVRLRCQILCKVTLDDQRLRGAQFRSHHGNGE